MGSDKALLSYGGQNLLQHALQITAAIGKKTFIVGPRDRYAAFGEVVEDVHPGCGPLGGIHAALRATETDLNLILSVDMPLMEDEVSPLAGGAGKSDRHFDCGSGCRGWAATALRDVPSPGAGAGGTGAAERRLQDRQLVLAGGYAQDFGTGDCCCRVLGGGVQEHQYDRGLRRDSAATAGSIGPWRFRT